LRYRWRGAQAAHGATPKFLLVGTDAQERLRHAIAVNAGGELRQLRALIEQALPIDAALLCDDAQPLRQRVRELLAASTASAPSLTS
jgi:3-phenylpropionate/trans-cinnamate dioxygenase ferredoxin reductase subunit